MGLWAALAQRVPPQEVSTTCGEEGVSWCVPAVAEAAALAAFVLCSFLCLPPAPRWRGAGGQCGCRGRGSAGD